MTVVYQNSDVSVETIFHFKVILDMNKIHIFLQRLANDTKACHKVKWVKLVPFKREIQKNQNDDTIITL